MTEMHALPVIFNILTLCGCWKPESWSSSYKSKLYDIYAIFMTVTLHTVSSTMALDVILNVETADDMTENFYLMLAMMMSYFKMISLFINRESIIHISNALAKEPFKASDDEEIDVQKRFDKMIRSKTTWYAIVVEMAVVCVLVTSIFVNFRERKLAYRAWLPFNYTSSTIFLFVFTHQLIGGVVGANLHVAFDSLFCIFLMETCCQFDFLKIRLNRISNKGDDNLGKCIRHHNRIYQYTRMINDTFKLVICIQFIESTFVVCCNLCQMVKIKTLSAELFQMWSYMSCILSQIFLYCWCGNEVKLKSLQVNNMIFESDWTALNVDAQRSLIMVMRRATIPTEFSSAHIITINLDTFVNLLKTSYTIYNLLQQTQQN